MTDIMRRQPDSPAENERRGIRITSLGRDEIYFPLPDEMVRVETLIERQLIPADTQVFVNYIPADLTTPVPDGSVVVAVRRFIAG